MKHSRHTFLLSLFAALFLCASLQPLFARADVYYEPENNFYRSHSAECYDEGRYYVANSPQDALYFYRSPGGSEVNHVEKGTRFYVFVTYTDKDQNVWGYAEPSSEISASGKGGWALLTSDGMNYAYPAYDNIEFQKDYETIEESGFAAADEDHPDLNLWDYPGGEIIATIPTYGDAPGYTRTFTDEEGRKWGYTGYYVGWRDIWFLIDEPWASEEELFPEGKPVRDTREFTDWSDPQNVPEPSTSTPRWMEIAVVVIPVAAVVAVSAVALWMIRKKKAQ